MRAARPTTTALAIIALTLLCTACERPGDRSAAELYPRQCARCHGADGRGNPVQLARYPNLDLTRSLARGGDARPFFRRRIAQGHGPMPGFSRKLSAPEIERLVDYSLQLAAQPVAGR